MGHWTWNRPILLVWFCPGDHIREPASSSISSGTSVSGLRELGPSFQLLFSDQRLRLSPWQSGFPPSLDAFAISLSLVTSRRAVLTLGWATTSVIDLTSLENLPCLSSELGKRHPCALEAPVWFLSAYLPSPPHTHTHRVWKTVTQGPMVQHRELHFISCDKPQRKRVYVHVSITESHCYAEIIDTTL